jgi:hypothetical protein
MPSWPGEYRYFGTPDCQDLPDHPVPHHDSRRSDLRQRSPNSPGRVGDDVVLSDLSD